MISSDQYWLLTAIAFWTALTTIFYSLFFQFGGFLRRVLCAFFAALLSFLIVSFLGWLFLSGEGGPSTLPYLVSGIRWEIVIETGLLLLWTGIGFLFSQTFNERMPLFLRLALGLLLSFVLIRYFCGMLRLISL